MKIVIENVSDQEVVNHPWLLVRGRVENLDMASVLKSPEDGRVFLTQGSSCDGKEQLQSIPIHPWGEAKAKFRLLVSLKQGKNSLTFEFFRIRRVLTVTYDVPKDPAHVIKLLYIVPTDTDGAFQVGCTILTLISAC